MYKKKKKKRKKESNNQELNENKKNESNNWGIKLGKSDLGQKEGVGMVNKIKGGKKRGG